MLTGNWTKEDARILKRLARQIVRTMIVKYELTSTKINQTPVWPKMAYAPSQQWIAALNT
jgi:hypothetical protein